MWTPLENMTPKYATNSDDPAERFLAVVAMALDSVAHAENPASMMINISAATISLARRDFYAMLAEQRMRVRATGAYEGIGSDDFSAWSGRVWGSVPLN